MRIFLVVSLYWFVSITMVFVNKSLLSGHRDLDAPFFVTWSAVLFFFLFGHPVVPMNYVVLNQYQSAKRRRS